MPNQGGSPQQHGKAGQQSHKNDEGTPRRADGQQQGGKRDQDQQGDHRGGSGNFADDRERASQAGRKGGQS